MQKLDRIDISKFNLNDGDTIVFSLGEIDCGCHVHKHITNVLKYETIIDNIIYNYFEAINFNLINANIKLKNICIFNIYNTFIENIKNSGFQDKIIINCRYSNKEI